MKLRQLASRTAVSILFGFVVLSNARQVEAGETLDPCEFTKPNQTNCPQEFCMGNDKCVPNIDVYSVTVFCCHDGKKRGWILTVKECSYTPAIPEFGCAPPTTCETANGYVQNNTDCRPPAGY
jgi:hypothetical protein